MVGKISEDEHMTQLWHPSTLPSRSAPDDGTFYRSRGELSQEVTKAAQPQPLPDSVDHNTPAEIRAAFIEKYWSEDAPGANL